MTKYILHGGATRNKTEDNSRFFGEIISSLSNNATILCVYFAKPKELWSEIFRQEKINFSSVAKGKVINFLLASEETDIFVEQIKKSDAIFLRGGDTDKLKEALSGVGDLGDLWKDKVVAGSSAGVYVLSKYYYTNTKDGISEGLGILPIKSFCHYTDEKQVKLEELKSYRENLKVYAIPEEKYFVIEQ